MSRHTEDPFLCIDCQKLGYCRLRAMQAEAERRAMQEKSAELSFRRQTSFQYPMLSADPEPMPTFREFVAVHRPDLSKHLPRTGDAASGVSVAKRPSLAELRASIAARKLSASPEAPTQAIEHMAPQEKTLVAPSIPATVATPSTASVTSPKRSKGGPRYATPRLRTDLVCFGEKPAKHQHYTPIQVSSTPHKEKKTLFPG